MHKYKEKIMSGVFLLAACTSIIAVIIICLFLFANGIPAIKEIGIFKFITGTVWRPSNDIYGILPMILGSIYVTAGAILIGVPIGIFTAAFMAYFCPKKIYRVLKPAVNLLAGIPSVIYGFFGLVVVVPFTGNSMLTASLILAVMILPSVIGVSETAIKAVPASYYEGALALGATHERSVFFTVIPAAKSGIFAGVVLGIGRAIGETMAVMMVAGNSTGIPSSIFKGVRTLTTNIAIEMGYAQDLHREALIATGVVLFVFILIINISARCLKGGTGIEQYKYSDSKAEIKAIQNKPLSILLLTLVILCSALTVITLFFIIIYILIKGIPHISPSLFEFNYNSENCSLTPALINTFITTALALLISVPLGIFSAIYLVEYAKRGK